MNCIKKLFVTDMDGTFLDEQGKFDRRRLERLVTDFEREGYLFAVASGRAILSLSRLFEGFEDRIALIAENGALVSYKNQTVFEQVMSPADYQEVERLLLSNPYLKDNRYLFSGKTGAYVLENLSPAYLQQVQHFYDGVELIKESSHLTDTIYKLTAQFDVADLPAAVADFNSKTTRFVAVPTASDAIDIIPVGLTKATGLKALCQHLALPLSQVTAYGDNYNDLEMLDLAGDGVAMANAGATIKERANRVIGDHRSAAVLADMEKAVADIRLLALDLDNTLFNSKKEVSPANKEALRLARERGVQVVITTGRPLKAINWLLEELDLVGADQYSITFNGGLVQRNDGEILAHHPMTLEEIARVQEVMENLALPVDVISEGTVFSIPSKGVKSLYQTANPMLEFVELTSVADLPQDRIYNKIVIVAESNYLDERIALLPVSLSQDFEVFKSREIILEVMPKGVHKAKGLADLCQILGLEAHQVMAMGDEENDLTMLDWAGWGFAMKNAVPHVKEVARLTTQKTNEESGVAEAIHHYILKEENENGII